MRSGKQKSMDRANKALQLRTKPITEAIEGESTPSDVQLGTPVVLLEGKRKGKVIGWIVALDEGGAVPAYQGDFYNNSDF
jgi:hypothetical protein